MCGIVGIIERESKIRSTDEIKKMMTVQRHRGPNDSGICGFSFSPQCCYPMQDELMAPEYCNGLVGFNRLSILDLTPNGHQPMISSDQKVILSFNGEIYNAFDYTRELSQKGYIFHGNSDTEVILNLYLEYGLEKMLLLLNGMFAISIIDLNLGKAYLIRDRFGIKPLYYAVNDQRLIYASELKSIIQTNHFKRELDAEALNEYFAFTTTMNACLMKNVEMVHPGQIITYDYAGNQVRKNQYFHINHYHRSPSHKSFNAEKERAEETLKQCIERQTLSDVKVGCQLSGGIDSSLVTYYASQYEGLDDSVSIVFDDKAYSEEPYIDHVLGLTGIQGHKVALNTSDLINDLETCIWHSDSMLNIENAIGIYHLSREAKKHVTVLLSGEGADEVWGGYGVFRGGRIASYRNKINSVFPWLSPSIYHGKEHHYYPHDFSMASFAVKATEDLTADIGKRFLPGFDSSRIRQNRLSLFNSLSGNDFDKHIKYEMLTYLPELLVRQDKMSMANSIENRVPLLDNDIVNLAFSLPQSHLMHTGLPRVPDKKINSLLCTKYMLKRLCEDKYGSKFTYRAKAGFALPLSAYYNDKTFREYILNNIIPSMKDRGIINTKTLSDAILNKRYLSASGTGSNSTTSTQISRSIWKCINLELWCKLFL